ncbi:Hypothetical predicted protein [Mytilus galloprovincialis]|uniref:Integrase catalytic domain-containing protein n=1 Tax=Mytilus galloprovincialis TaxID=29158 RepID=A0A8B6G0S3_MYTGA|nr:Hypothetical predicted protein [Mytilus galloprovincialis]
MEAIPIPHQHADLVAQKLVMEFIARFGIPLELHTDQGKNFESDLFKSVCNLFQINKTRTTAYHPSSNGLIERFNKTLGGMIKTFVNKNVTNWDEYINLLLAAYRSTPHPATGFSPNYMMLGREVNIPLNLMFRSHENRTQNNEDYIATIKSHFQNVYEIARENLKSNAERQKRDHDTRLTDNRYELGALVYKFDKTVNKKFRSPWLGPFVITKILSPVVYEIRGEFRTESTNPYNVKIGSDIFIKTTLITPSTQKSEIEEKFEEEFILDYDEEITISEEEVAIMEVEVDERDEQIEGLKNKIKEMEEKHREDNRSMEETHKKQIKELEERHKFECLRFRNFIQRLEKRKEELKKELKSAEKKLENENICTKKIKSVVTLPIKRKLNFR